MIKQKSITGRVATGKVLGLILGVLIFFGGPAMGAEMTEHFKWGLIFFYILLGAMIGMAGIMTRHPLFDFAMPFWVRGPILGVVFHLMLVLIGHPHIVKLMEMTYVKNMGLEWPFWILVDGLIIGLIMDWILTKRCGEGDLPVS